MFDKLDDREKYVLVGASVVGLLLSFTAGAVVAGDSGLVGSFFGGQDADEDQISQSISSYMDRQMTTQRQRLRQVANRSENMTMEELSIDYQINDISRSSIKGLYVVNATITGVVPERLGNGTRQLNESNLMYISEDGRFLFQKPTDLMRQRKLMQRQQTAPTQ